MDGGTRARGQKKQCLGLGPDNGLKAAPPRLVEQFSFMRHFAFHALGLAQEIQWEADRL